MIDDTDEMVRETFYLTQQQIEELEILQLRLRTQIKGALRRVGKSELVRVALDCFIKRSLEEVARMVEAAQE